MSSNTINPTDFLSTLSDYLAAETARDRSTAKARNVRKRFENMGCDMPALALMLSLRKLEPEEAEQRLRNALRYSRWANMKIGDQGDLFTINGVDAPAEKATAEWTEAQAVEEGYAAGKAGRDPNDSRFPLGSPLAQKHYEGWVQGQAYLAEALGREPAEGETLKPAKRGRPKASGATPTAPTPKGRRNGADAHP